MGLILTACLPGLDGDGLPTFLLTIGPKAPARYQAAFAREGFTTPYRLGP